MMGRPGGPGGPATREPRCPGGPVRPGGGPGMMGMGMGQPVAKAKSFRPTFTRLLGKLTPGGAPDRARDRCSPSAACSSSSWAPSSWARPPTWSWRASIPGSGGLDSAALAGVLVKLAGVYLLSSILAWAQAWVMAGVTQRSVYRLRQEVDRKLGRMPLKTFDSRPRGDLLSRVTNDIDNIGATLQQSLTQLITALLTIVGVLIMMLTISPLLALISILAVPLSLFITAKIAKRSQPQFVVQWASTGSLNGHIEEMHTGHSIVKLFGRQQQAIETFRTENERLYEASRKAQFISGTIQPALNFVSNLNYVAIAVIGGLQVAAGAMSLGDVVAFIQYARQFTMPIIQTASIANLIQSAVASAERVFELLDEPEEIPDPVAPRVLTAAKGGVRFADVSFRYQEDTPLIEHLDLDVAPGSTVAIVGPTGAGKTTLVNLLMRFYEIDSGAILIDGIDTREMTRDDLRSTFGMVLQDTWLFKGTIRDNIAYGREGATEAEVLAAAEAAHVDHFVRTLHGRLRHGHRRRRHERLGGREAAADHRPGIPGRPADAHPGRGHELRRHPHRGAHPARDVTADGRPDHVRHRPPAVHHP